MTSVKLCLCTVLDGLKFSRIVNGLTDSARLIRVDDPLNMSKSQHLSSDQLDLLMRAFTAPSSIAASTLAADINYHHHMTLFNVRLFDFRSSKGIGVIACEPIPKNAVIMELSGPIITDKREYLEIDERIRKSGIDSHFFCWKSHTISKSNPW
jgi:hypothetical protein